MKKLIAGMAAVVMLSTITSCGNNGKIKENTWYYLSSVERVENGNQTKLYGEERYKINRLKFENEIMYRETQSSETDPLSKETWKLYKEENQYYVKWFEEGSSVNINLVYKVNIDNGNIKLVYEQLSNTYIVTYIEK